MIPVSYYAPTEVTSPRFAFAFAKGCKGTFTDELELFPGPVALFGSPSRWPVLRKAIAEGREWYYGDHAYFGRGRFYRVTRNAFQHDGTGEYGPDRYAVFNRPVQPWRASGGHVLICPNSAVYFGLHGLNVDTWLRDVVETLRRFTDRDLRIRWKTTRTAIKDDLLGAWAVVCFSSAAALDALIAGIPVFVLAPFAAGYRMGLANLSRIETPVYPDDREPFLWALASNQWTLPEMIRGIAWRALQEGAGRAS